jgi:hypothetical protein
MHYTVQSCNQIFESCLEDLNLNIDEDTYHEATREEIDMRVARGYYSFEQQMQFIKEYGGLGKAIRDYVQSYGEIDDSNVKNIDDSLIYFILEQHFRNTYTYDKFCELLLEHNDNGDCDDDSLSS